MEVSRLIKELTNAIVMDEEGLALFNYLYCEICDAIQDTVNTIPHLPSNKEYYDNGYTHYIEKDFVSEIIIKHLGVGKHERPPELKVKSITYGGIKQ